MDIALPIKVKLQEMVCCLSPKIGFVFVAQMLNWIEV